ncbi:hypothetical protein [Absidia glauca]|uniref:AB hydrolase-1 domain-containing protein n=1 Tax=Absidia glauca TaxID=4829 RepID=A0A163MPH9_ABSGL|nr:hypothetical protein [Absidia glauca]
MPRLIPTESTTISVHPGTLGYEIQKLAVDKHCFKAPQQPSKQKLALVFSHSNGFNKETLHPLIRQVVKGMHQQDRYQQTDLCVFAWDARNHGDSARLNEGTLLESYTWFDNALDTQQIVRTFDLHSAYDGVIGIGHSFGATSMLLAEFLYPNTFTAICAIEPVMGPGVADTEVRAQLPMLSSLKRRDTWPDKETCFKSLAHRQFWKIMDPEVLDLYVNYALYETSEGTVKLKTPKEQEFHVFNVSSYGTATAYSSLRAVNIPVQFIYGQDSTYVYIDPLALPELNPKYIRAVQVEGTHMVPNEHPAAMVPLVIQVIDAALSSANKKSMESKL